MAEVDPVIEAVRADLHRRSQLGIEKYGMTLAGNSASLRERLQHAYEEALDLSNYLKWAIMQLDGGVLYDVPILADIAITDTTFGLSHKTPPSAIHKAVGEGAEILKESKS